MWWETIYSFGLTTGCVIAAMKLPYLINIIDVGRWGRRDTSSTIRYVCVLCLSY